MTTRFPSTTAVRSLVPSALRARPVDRGKAGEILHNPSVMLNSFQHPWTWRFRYIPSRCSWIPKQVRDDRKRTNRSLARPPFLPEPVPIGQPLGDLHFKAPRRGGVEALRLNIFRAVIVAGKGSRRDKVVHIDRKR